MEGEGEEILLETPGYDGSDLVSNQQRDESGREENEHEVETGKLGRWKDGKLSGTDNLGKHANGRV